MPASNILIDFLEKSDDFRVHTGDVGAWSELKLRTFENMSEELIECLRLQLADWDPATGQMGGIDFCLCKSSKSCPAQPLQGYKREDLKITVKVFLSDPPDADSVKSCLQALIKELKVNYIDQLIVAIFPLDPAKYVQPTLSTHLLALWPDLESFVTENRLCAALGTSDLDLYDLKRVWEGAKNVKPLVNHYNIAACCTVPPELKEYAKKKNVVLLTHNDPHPFLTTQQVQELFIDKLKVPECLAKQWTAKWAGRATVMDHGRSVIVSKAYIVHFQKRKLK